MRGTLSHGLNLRPFSIDRLVSYIDVDWLVILKLIDLHLGLTSFLVPTLFFCPPRENMLCSRSSVEVEYREVGNAVVEYDWLPNLLIWLHCLLSRFSFSVVLCKKSV